MPFQAVTSASLRLRTGPTGATLHIVPIGGMRRALAEQRNRQPLLNEPVNQADAELLAKAFKALGDPVRIRLLSRIAEFRRAIPVYVMAEDLKLSGPAISHHLKVLREAGLVASCREGIWVYYWILPSSFDALTNLLDTSIMPPRVA